MFNKLKIKRSERIAVRNDAFRWQTGCAIITHGVMCDVVDLQGLMDRVAAYDVFTFSNDPYGEHDFGALDFEGKEIFWKIDYYDQSNRNYCDPLSPSCKRVLTVMLAEEY